MKAMTIMMLGAAALWSAGHSRATEELAARRRAEIVAELDLPSANGSFALPSARAWPAAALSIGTLARAGETPARRAP